jgi:hypothetical protein
MMGAIIGAVTGFLGISSLRLYIYIAVTVAVIIAGFTIRQHFINVGWNKAMTRVEKQNDKAAAAAAKVKERADSCSENSWWDVVSASCKTEDAQ